MGMSFEASARLVEEENGGLLCHASRGGVGCCVDERWMISDELCENYVTLTHPLG